MPRTIDPRIATAARVQVVPIASLRPWDRNPHTGDLEEVTRSLQRFGQVVPIVRAPDGWIISGNTTLKGMDSLGYEQCAVVTLDADENEQIAWGLASNRIGTRGQDDDTLVLQLLREIEVLEGTGYDVDDLSDLEALQQEVATADGRMYGPMDQTTGLATTEPSFDERLEGYQAHQVRSIILDYNVDTYTFVTEQCTALRSALSVESNAALFVRLIADASGMPVPS